MQCQVHLEGFMYSPLCAADVPSSFGSLLFCSFSLRRWPTRHHVGEYAKSESAMTPSTMYSPLMPLSRCFLHLIYLPIYVFSYMSTLVRGHGPHYTCLFFFWRFQPPDALYMLWRLYRKVNPFRSDLLLLLKKGKYQKKRSKSCVFYSAGTRHRNGPLNTSTSHSS
jgi:hypothetical protein